MPLKIRPIVSCTFGHTHTVSAYIDSFLQTIGTLFILNSLHILHTLSQTTLPPHTLLIALDVESLYTNITHDRAICTFTRLFKHHTQFVFLLDLLKHVLYNNVFTFDGKCLKQIGGLAIGMKLTHALATLVMAAVEQDLLCTQQHKITKKVVLYKYYMYKFGSSYRPVYGIAIPYM